jgi:hypothetical protein
MKVQLVVPPLIGFGGHWASSLHWTVTVHWLLLGMVQKCSVEKDENTHAPPLAQSASERHGEQRLPPPTHAPAFGVHTCAFAVSFWTHLASWLHSVSALHSGEQKFDPGLPVLSGTQCCRRPLSSGQSMSVAQGEQYVRGRHAVRVSPTVRWTWPTLGALLIVAHHQPPRQSASLWQSYCVQKAPPSNGETP